MPAITRTCRFSEPEVPPTRLCPVRHPSVAIRKLLSLGDHPVPRSNASCLDHDFPFFRSKQDTFGSGNGQKLTFWFKLTFEVESPLLWVDCAPPPTPLFPPGPWLLYMVSPFPHLHILYSGKPTSNPVYLQTQSQVTVLVR